MTVELTHQQSDILEQNVLSKFSVSSPPQSATTESTKQLSNNSLNTSSTNTKVNIDEQASPSSNNDDKKIDTSSSLSVICSTNPTSSANNSANDTDSISPSLPSQGESSKSRSTLKRARGASCERPTSSEPSVSSEEQPPAKKVSYSIMNILGKNTEKENGSDKKHQSYPQSTQPDISAFIQQQLSGVGGMNQFMMNPFLAAAAALSNHQNNSQQNQMPWLNMAAMSSLCGLESKKIKNYLLKEHLE